jgi:hypothetical protein
MGDSSKVLHSRCCRCAQQWKTLCPSIAALSGGSRGNVPLSSSMICPLESWHATPEPVTGGLDMECDRLYWPELLMPPSLLTAGHLSQMYLSLFVMMTSSPFLTLFTSTFFVSLLKALGQSGSVDNNSPPLNVPYPCCFLYYYLTTVLLFRHASHRPSLCRAGRERLCSSSFCV